MNDFLVTFGLLSLDIYVVCLIVPKIYEIISIVKKHRGSIVH